MPGHVPVPPSTILHLDRARTSPNLPSDGSSVFRPVASQTDIEGKMRADGGHLAVQADARRGTDGPLAPRPVEGVPGGVVVAGVGVGLLADAEPENGGGARLGAADGFQVYPGEARRREPDAVAEENRQDVDEDLVD